MSIKKVSELVSGSYIGNDDILYISQDTGAGLVSKQITLDDIQRSIAYSVVKQDINVEYSNTHNIGNASGGTFNSLFLGTGGLHIGEYDGISSVYNNSHVNFDSTFDGLLIDKNIATNNIHLGYISGSIIADSGVTMNYTYMDSPQYTGNTVMFYDEDSIINSGYTRTVDLFGQVVPKTGNEGDILAKTTEYTYDWQSKSQLGLATTGSNTFYGTQIINGGLEISGLTSGSFSDNALVINPTTHVVGTMPQGLRTTYGLFSQTGNSVTVSGTTIESTIIDGGVGTLSVPANGFTVGDSFRADLGGVMNAANNQTIRIRAKSGTVIFLDSGIQNLGSSIIGDIFTLSINFVIRQVGVAGVANIVTLGRFSYAKTNNGTVQGFGFNTVNNTTFDTTITNTLDITVEWGSDNVGNNIYTDLFTLNKIY